MTTQKTTTSQLDQIRREVLDYTMDDRRTAAEAWVDTFTAGDLLQWAIDDKANIDSTDKSEIRKQDKRIKAVQAEIDSKIEAATDMKTVLGLLTHQALIDLTARLLSDPLPVIRSPLSRARQLVEACIDLQVRVGTIGGGE